MALASYHGARSPVELSLSPVYQYQYSSIFKAVAQICPDDAKRTLLEQELQRISMSYFDHSSADNYLLQTDTTPYCRAHSPSLPDRTFVSIPNNAVPGNRPLSIGYELSCVNICDPQSRWSLPLSFKRVSLEETPSQCAHRQLDDLLSNPDLPFSEKRLINTCDSKYGTAEFLCEAHRHPQLINIVRLRSGMRIRTPYNGPQKAGRRRIYDQIFYLHRSSIYKTYKNYRTGTSSKVYQRSIFEHPCDDHIVFNSKTTKGREIRIELWRFNNLLLGNKSGHNMADKPLDLLVVEVRDAQSNKLIFGREMYIAICGQQKDQIATRQAYQFYRYRYGIEHYLRFGKQHLLLHKFQTPDINHLDNWLLIQQSVPWLLYAASAETTKRPRKWEKYLPENKNDHSITGRLTISQTRKALEPLFLTLDLSAFKPQKSKNGKGRRKGTTFEPRKRYKRVKKTAYKRKAETKVEQIE